MEMSMILIQWEPLEGQTLSPEFSGYTAGHYSTGNPELGWCLYSRGAGGCWNQRTKQIKAPSLDHQPERIDGQWYWLLPDKHSKDAVADAAQTSTHTPAPQWLKELRDTWKSSKPNSDVAEVLEVVVRRLERDLDSTFKPSELATLERAVIEAAKAMCAVGMIDPWDSDNAPLYSNLAIAVDALVAACENDKIPEINYLGSTKDGEQYHVPPEGIDNFNTLPPRILNSKVAATFRELPTDFPPLEARGRCERCGEQISRQADGEPWEHVSNKSIYCPNDETGCSIATPISEPGASIAEVTIPRRYLQLTDYEKEGQLFQIEFREDLFELKVQNENGKPVILTLTEREFMIDAAVPTDIDEGAVEDARRECDEPLSASHRHSQAVAVAYSAAGMQRVANDPPPAGQKYAPGTRVRIADDLGPAMSHFPKGRMATVRYTYAHAFGGDDVTSYCLDVDGIGETSWYKEDQLTLVPSRIRVPPPTQT